MLFQSENPEEQMELMRLNKMVEQINDRIEGKRARLAEYEQSKADRKRKRDERKTSEPKSKKVHGLAHSLASRVNNF